MATRSARARFDIRVVAPQITELLEQARARPPWSVHYDGSIDLIGLIAPDFAQAVAIETLDTDTVVAWRQGEPISLEIAPWFITVFKHARRSPEILLDWF